MNMPDKDGVTPQQHLTAIWKSLGGTPQTKPADLTPPCEFPSLLSHVWEWFSQMSMRRGFSEYGPQPITWESFGAWRVANRINPSVRETELIMSLDAAFFKARAK